MRKFLQGITVSALLIALSVPAFAQTPPFTVSFTSNSYTVAENGPSTVTLTRTGTLPKFNDVQFLFTELPSGHQTGSTYRLLPDQVTSHVFPFSDDKYYNPGRSFLIKIVSVDSGGVVVEPSSATLTIIDDEQPPVISIYDLTVDEGNPVKGQATALNNAHFRVALTSALPGITFVPVAVVGGSAKQGVDYLWSGGGVTFGDGQQTGDLSVPIICDLNPEGDKTFTVQLMPAAPIVAGQTTAICTIRDDDDPVTPVQQNVSRGGVGKLSIRLTDPAVAAEQVTLQSSGPALCTLPPLVTIAAGASGADLNFVCPNAGTGAIVATLPASRGGRSYTVGITVYDVRALSYDPILVSLSFGGTAMVTARIDPPSSVPVVMTLRAFVGGVVDVPAEVVFDSNGEARIPVRAIGSGGTNVRGTLFAVDGGTYGDFAVSVISPGGPLVTGVSPSYGASTGGEKITITGNGFAGHCVATFDDRPVKSVVSQSSGAIVVMTPPHIPDRVDVAVRCGTKKFVVPNAFRFDLFQPILTEVGSVNIGPARGTRKGGTYLRLHGLNFDVDLCTVRLDGVAVPVIYNGFPTDVGIETPPHAAGVVPVSITCGNATATLPKAFEFTSYDDPQLYLPFGIYTTTTGGNYVYEDHYNARLDDQILLNGVLAEDFGYEYSWHFRYPETLGSAKLTYVDYAGRSYSRNVEVVAPDLPVVKVFPSSITAGGEFVLAGAALRRGVTFLLDATPLSPVSITSSAATLRAPATVGTGIRTFSTLDRGIVGNTKAVQVIAGPVITSISPTCAPIEGGSFVTISGDGFQDGAAIQFGTTDSADVTVKDPFTIRTKVPEWFNNRRPVITVINPDGATATLTGVFTYNPGGCPPEVPNGRRRAAGH
ncbi:MAG: large repetitive protein [Thermoanaerobaculia bacterium]|jgi:hypothetical protein|nr:large repetitive protein [Thermoanaerobaculia bacterium]